MQGRGVMWRLNEMQKRWERVLESDGPKEVGNNHSGEQQSHILKTLKVYPDGNRS